MCVTQFRRLCEKGKFYHFISEEEFDKRIDYDGNKLKHITFKELQYNQSGIPTDYTAYGVEEDEEYFNLLSLYEEETR